MHYPRLKVEKDPFQATRKKVILTIVVILILILSLVFYFLKDDSEPLTSNYPICDFSQEEIVNIFSDYHFDETVIIEDYFFYGESLSLFEDSYDINKVNSLLGRTFLLRNVCNKEEFFYLIDDNINEQIPLNLLPEGLYEVFVNIDLVRKRILFNEDLIDDINTVRRHNISKNVELIANKNIFDDSQNQDLLDKNYLFINVKNNENLIEDYDIVLDPGLGTNANGYFDNYGASFLGMVEADELYDFAVNMQKELEAKGLKVLITRSSKDDIINLYGKNNRLNKAYDSKAKYYIELNLNNTLTGGLRVYKSSYASSAFASYIANYLLDNTNLREVNKSVFSAPRFNGLDGVITIREMGGKALAAATFSELAASENASFALNNKKGLEALSIELFSYLNEEELANYKVNKEKYAQATALALIEYLNLGVIDDISD